MATPHDGSSAEVAGVGNRDRSLPNPRETLAFSVLDAARGRRSAARSVRLGPECTWDVVTDRLLASTRVEYLGSDDPSVLANAGMTERMFERGSRAMTEMLARGVRVDQLTTPAGVAVDGDLRPALQFRRGGRARVVDELPLKACVLDRRMALVAADDRYLPDGMLVFTDPVVVDALAELHRGLRHGGAEPAASVDAPPPRLRPVLATLSSGIPDEAAARRLRISTRTYSRRVRELTALLGASSRFEAGARARRRGWL